MEEEEQVPILTKDHLRQWSKSLLQVSGEAKFARAQDSFPCSKDHCALCASF
jgi:hypothetical protein